MEKYVLFAESDPGLLGLVIEIGEATGYLLAKARDVQACVYRFLDAGKLQMIAFSQHFTPLTA